MMFSVWWRNAVVWRSVSVALALLLMLCSLIVWSMLEQRRALEDELAQAQLLLEARLSVAEEAPEQPSACPESGLPLADQTLQQICSAYLAYAQSQRADDRVDAFVSARLEQDIQQKYAFLLQAVALGKQDSEQLIQLLLERESILNAPVQGYFAKPEDRQELIAEQQLLLGEIDGRVREVLGQEAYNKYELLKDSGFEQYQLEQFSQSLQPSEQISTEQQSQLLLAKLQYRQVFDQQLAQWQQGATGSEVAPAESVDMARLREALETFKTAYYSDSAALLSTAQLKHLKAYENAQFDALLNSYRAQVPAGE
ncbi:MAG TPA: hypothetical protein VIC26_01685 [Marinagarivorans sp.]